MTTKSKKSKITSSKNYDPVKSVNECIRDFKFEDNDFDYIKAGYKLELDSISVFIDKLSKGEPLTELEEKILLDSSLKLSRLKNRLISKTESNTYLIEELRMELSGLIHDRYGVWI